MDKKIILARIDELMKEKGITKYELKENAEVSSTIYQWRKNATRDKDRTPSLRSIEKICEFFGISLAYFFTFDKENQMSARIDELTNNISSLNDEQLSIIELIVKQFMN